MKITQKILQKIIKEEVQAVLEDRKSVEAASKWGTTPDEQLVQQLTGGDAGDILEILEELPPEDRMMESQFQDMCRQYVAGLGPNAMEIHMTKTKGMSPLEIVEHIITTVRGGGLMPDQDY